MEEILFKNSSKELLKYKTNDSKSIEKMFDKYKSIFYNILYTKISNTKRTIINRIGNIRISFINIKL